MILAFTLLCIFGAFLLHWRRASLGGYFDSTPRSPGAARNVPGVFEQAIGNLLVLAIGIVAYWGSVLLLLLTSGWEWAALGLFGGFILKGLLLRWFCGPPRWGRSSASRVYAQSPGMHEQLGNRAVRTLDSAFLIYQRRDPDAPIVASPSPGTEIQLGDVEIFGGREWVEAMLPNGVRGYAVGPNVRGHSRVII